jgi:O-antigen ligase
MIHSPVSRKRRDRRRDVTASAGTSTGEIAATRGPDRDPRAPSDTQSSREVVFKFASMAIVSSWVGYVVFVRMPAFTFDVFPATITLHAVVGGGLLVYAACMVATRRLPGGTPLDLPVVGFIGAYALATYGSIDWRVSLEPVLLLGAAVGAFYALSDLPLLNARTLRYGLMLVGAALSVYALWIVGNDYADYLRLTESVEGITAGNIFPATVPRVRDVSDHPNVVAMVLVLIMPHYMLSSLRPASWWERALAIAGLIVAGWAIFLTLSRGGWIGVAVGSGFTAVAAWITTSAYQREEAGERVTWVTFLPAGFSPTALAAVVGAFALAVFGALAFVASWSTRPGWLFRASLSAREDAWNAGLDIFRDNWLNGTGPHTFGLLYPQYGEHVSRFIVHTQHAHNGFLQVANDAGMIGLLALSAIGAAVVYMLWRTWRTGTLEARLVAVACAGSLLGFSAHQQLDAGNSWKAPAFTLAFVGAIIVRGYRESRLREDVPVRTRTAPALVRRYASLAARGALPLLLLALFAGWYRVDRPHYDYYQGLSDWNLGDPSGIARLQDAVDADSSMMVYQLQLGVAQASAFDGGGRVDDELIDGARIHLERAAQIDPRSDLARANLARVYEYLGRDEHAAQQAQLARLATYHVTPVLVAGEVYEDLGRDTDAISTYAQVISMDAGLANSTFWEMTDWRREHYAEILAESTIAYSACTYGAFLVEAARFGGSTSSAELEGARDDCQFTIFTRGLGNDLPSRVALAQMELELGESEEAYGHLRYAVARQPDFGPARTELGRWYDAEGDVEEARHQWAVGSQLDDAEAARLLGDSYPVGEVPSKVVDRLRDLVGIQGSSVRNDLVSILYYRMRYGRLSPVFPLIPGTWIDAIPRPYAAWLDALGRWEAEETTTAN